MKYNKETDFRSVFRCLPGIAVLLLPDSPDFTIVEATSESIPLSIYKDTNLAGKKFFEAFPCNSGVSTITREKNIKNALNLVIETKKPSHIEVERYDIKNRDGIFVESYWQVLNTPVINEEGNISYIIHTSVNISDKVLSDKRAMNAQDNFRYYLGQAIAPFAILSGEDFVFTFANDAYRTLMNGRILVGKRVEDAIPELKGQPFLALLNNVFHTGVPFHSAEIPAIAIYEGDTEPTTRYFNLSYTPYTNPEGVIEGVLASGYDVTEMIELRKNEQRNIINSKAYDLFRQAPGGICILEGPDMVFGLINAHYQKLFPGRALLGKRILEAIPELKDSPVAKILKDVYESGNSYEGIEVALPVPGDDNGLRDRYFNFTYQPRTDFNGIIDGIFVFVYEVTDMVRAKHQLEESELFFRNMLETIPQITWTTLPNGKANFYNQCWYNYTRLNVDETMELGWNTTVHSEDLEKALYHFNTTISGTTGGEHELRLRRFDGEFRWHLVRYVPMKDKNDKIQLWVGTATDIHDLRLLQRQKDDFLAIASHELKTPLTSVKAYIQLLPIVLRKDDLVTSLNIIKRTENLVNKMIKLIHNFLDLSKLESAQLEMEFQYFNINDLISDVIKYYNLPEDKDRLSFHKGKVPEIKADKLKVGQVIDNFISNALKYSSPDKMVEIKTEYINNSIIVSVKDYGQGINPASQHKIFQRFFRADNVKSGKASGFGIGLYFSAEIVRLHNGKTWFESKEGEGSVFYFSLPVK